MAKAVYVGVGSKARKMKKAYIGIGGKARKVKKMYIGVGGKARLCYSAELEKVGMAESLSDERRTVAASVGNYALFAGGYGYWRYSAVIYDAVDAYSASLTKSMPTALSTVRESHAGASVEGYALFAGGANGTRSTDIVDSVDAYSASLTRTAAATLSGKRKWIGAASLEGRAFFAGGASTNLNSNTKCANVEVYNGTHKPERGKIFSTDRDNRRSGAFRRRRLYKSCGCLQRFTHPHSGCGFEPFHLWW